MSKFYDYKIKYRTLDQLISAVADDWPGYDAENLIDPSQLIKVVRRINKQLGLRITKTRESIITFDNWLVNVPDDLQYLNFALVCGRYVYSYPLPQGVHTENVDVDCSNGCTDVFITPFGDTYRIIKRSPSRGEISFEILKQVHMKHTPYQIDGEYVEGTFLNENFIKMNIKSGNIYLNYEGLLEDENGNLLVVDHPIINEYYEYSLKERILENMYYTGEDTERKLGFIQQKLQMVKREAYNVANMPEFREIQEVIDFNRQAAYKKYYSVFI
jgi:hypothetical protein